MCIRDSIPYTDRPFGHRSRRTERLGIVHTAAAAAAMSMMRLSDCAGLDWQYIRRNVTPRILQLLGDGSAAIPRIYRGNTAGTAISLTVTPSVCTGWVKK